MSTSIGILVHGGLDRAYSASHPLAVFCRDTLHLSSVHSITLPLHGTADLTRTEQRIIASTTGAEQLSHWLHALLEALEAPLAVANTSGVRHVFLVTFSLGALSVLAALESIRARVRGMRVTVVCVGACLGLTDELAQAIGDFWTLDAWEARMSALLRAHTRPKIEATIAFAHRFVGSASSPLLPSAQQRASEYMNDDVFFINGASDLPFPPFDAVTGIAEADGAPREWIARHCIAIESGHFDYFSPSTWKAATRPALEQVAYARGLLPAAAKL